MMTHTSKVKQLSLLCSVVLLVVLFLFNAILARATVRLDLTEEGLYTLSDGSERILGRLEDPARIRVFWHNVPLRFDGTKRYVAALLEEMEGASDGKVTAQWVDMSEDAGLDQARELDLEEHSFGVRHGAEFRQARGYMSLVIELGDEPPVKINELANITDKLEYRIVSSIFKIQRAAPPIVGLVAPRGMGMAPGMRRPPSRFAYLERELRFAFGAAFRDYITLDEPVAPDVEVLIVADPRDFSEEQVYHFEQFLLRGGRGLLLVDRLDVMSVAGREANVVRPNESGFEAWLENLGVTVEKSTVVDFHEDATCLYPYERRDGMGRTVGVDWVRYAHWPKVLPENMDESNPVMRYLPPMATYWPAPLGIDDAKQVEAGRTVTILATTSEEGHRRQDVTNIRRPGFTKEGKLLETVPLIALVEGPTVSFWKGKPVPGTEPPEADEPEEGAGEEAPGEDAAAGEEDAAGSPDGQDAPGEDAPEGDDAPADPAPVEPGQADPEKKAPGEEPAEDEPAPADPEEKAPGEEPAEGEPAPADADAEGGEDRGEPPAPADGDGNGDTSDEDAAEPEEPAGPERLDEGSVRFVLMGDADLVGNTFNPQTFLTQINGATGFTFVHNMADWLGGSEELMALRARATNPRNLEQLDEGERDVIAWVNLLLVPLLMVLAGMTVFFVRRS